MWQLLDSKTSGSASSGLRKNDLNSSDTSVMIEDDNEDEDEAQEVYTATGIVIMIVGLVLDLLVSILPPDPVPQHDSILTGNMYYLELMRTPSKARFLDVTRMKKKHSLSFLLLLNYMVIFKIILMYVQVKRL